MQLSLSKCFSANISSYVIKVKILINVSNAKTRNCPIGRGQTIFLTETTDPMPTLGPSRNSADPCTSEVTTEPTDEDRCLRPLQRARERRAARLQKESDAHAVTNFDPHDSASQRSSASCDLEQDRPQLQCGGCNNILTESDLSAWDDLNQPLKRAGLSRLAETEDAPACAACLNHWSL